MKRYGAIEVLHGVDFDVPGGTVHALLGQNGAGKSTLIKILTGAESADIGDIFIEGTPVRFSGTLDSRKAGIAAVYQELSLVPDLTVAENLFLGSLPLRGGLVAWRTLLDAAREALAWLPGGPDPRALVRDLPVAERQLVEISRAVAGQCRVLILDEPTAAIGPHEVERLFGVVRSMRERGVGIVYISHRLDEVAAIADRVTVLRDGRRVFSGAVADCDRAALIGHMVGRDAAAAPQEATAAPRDAATPAAAPYAAAPQRPAPGEPAVDRAAPPVAAPHAASSSPAPSPATVLAVNGLSSHEPTGRPRFSGISFEVKAGEVLGLTGPVGSGAMAVARSLFGLAPLTSGHASLDGAPYAPRSPLDAMERGVAFVSDDRGREGLVAGGPVVHNISAAVLRRFTRVGLLDTRAERQLAGRQVQGLGIVPPDPDYPAGSLSGGNQQKVVLARWLARGARLFILCEPTRGMDVAAKRDVHDLVRGLRDGGSAVLLVSSEYEEVSALCDRVVVMRSGLALGELAGAGIAPEAILALAAAEPGRQRQEAGA